MHSCHWPCHWPLVYYAYLVWTWLWLNSSGCPTHLLLNSGGDPVKVLKMSTCSCRSVTHQLNRPSLTQSTLPSWLTNIGLSWRVDIGNFDNEKSSEMWGERAEFQPASTELFSLGEEAKEVWDDRTSSPSRGDLDALAKEHCLQIKEKFIFQGCNIVIIYKNQPLEIISMSVECQFCTFSYAALCCTWIVCFMIFKNLYGQFFLPPSFFWWEIGCLLASQGRSVTFLLCFTLFI